MKAILLAALFWAKPGAISSRHAPADFDLTANASSPAWRSIAGVVMDSDYFGAPVPGHRTEVRSRWTAGHLYLLFICQYDELNLKPDPSTAAETPQLWNWDVAEAFLGSDLANIVRYKEFQVSPQGEWIDLDINRTKGARGGGAAWNSGMQVKARVDAAAKVWYGEMKIPFEALFEGAPAAGRELRAGFFRIAGVDPAKKKISWQATGTKTFHVPEKFGILRLVE
jgi:hypothetical protein